ncbi:MAG: hypothetical protein HUU38_17180 [Anaerolineales bacterium]|nr:hypothetical protein [Anaerolineales bacterium]
MPKQSNPDFELFASITTHIRSEFVELDESWKDSPFAWIHSLSSGSRGKLGKRLVSAWCASKGLLIDSSPDSDADLLVNGHRIEIKFSTLWKSGIYKFQQIRDQNYEFVICLGISPFDAHCWVINKNLLYEYIIGHKPQHKGAKGTDTFWFSVKPNNPPDWLLSTGGTLNEAFEILKGLKRIRK